MSDRSGDAIRHREAVAIWTTHGPADAITTIYASRSVGEHVEANPIVAELLAIGDIPTVAIMCACVAVAAAVWPVAADAIDAPPAVAIAVAAIGAIVALTNLAVAL